MCDGKATSRKVEFEHWKRSQLLGSNLCGKNVHQSNMETNTISATDKSSKISDYSDEDQRGENPKGQFVCFCQKKAKGKKYVYNGKWDIMYGKKQTCKHCGRKGKIRY